MSGALANRFRLSLLTSVVVILALTQILPQVDLPDTAFHENDAPAVAKHRLVPVLAVLPLFSLGQVQRSASPLAVSPGRFSLLPQHATAKSLRVLLAVFLC